MRRTLSVMRTKWASGLLAVALLLLGSKPAAAAQPPEQEKADAKESPASFRAYLPTIRLKALLDNERHTVADLEEWLRKYNVWLESGFVNLVQRDQIEAELHRSRLRVLRLDTDYRDSQDQFTSRFRISEERRRQMEDAATAPLTKVFQRSEEFFREKEAAFIVKPAQISSAADVAKVRPVMVKTLTESAFVKNTTLPKRFLKHWDEGKKIQDRRKLWDRITKIQGDLHQLRLREAELAGKQQELPDADRQRMQTLKFELDTVDFQRALIHYEEQPWKNMDNDAARTRGQPEDFFGLERVFWTLLDHAYVERFEGLVQSWPGLAPVKIKDVDLLACKPNKAEETVAALLKTPDAKRAGKKKVRHIRMMAESYRIQQKISHLAYRQRDAITGMISSPPDTHPTDKDRFLGSRTLPEALREISQVRRQLLRTWIDYQMARLDLYGVLGLSPPER